MRRSTSVSDALADLQADGRFAFVDDDLSMLRDALSPKVARDARGPRPQDHASLASWGGWSRPSHIENRGNDFPELPGASMSRSGSGNWVAPVPVPDGPRGGDASPLSAPVHRGLRRAGARSRRNNPQRIASSQFLATKRPTSFQRRLRIAPRSLPRRHRSKRRPPRRGRGDGEAQQARRSVRRVESERTTQYVR